MRVVAADRAHIAEAAERLRSGRLVAFPTETVYGLGGDATNARAVADIFELKARPSFNPLIVHVADLAEAETVGVFDERARLLAAAFWPGPLSIVVPRPDEGKVCDLACAGGSTVAVRVPDHPVAQALLAAAKRPLAAPSANPSGYLSPTAAEHVAQAFGQADLMVLDGGPCTVGLESTVVDCSSRQHTTMLRSGGVPLSDVTSVVSDVCDGTRPDGEQPRSPGMLSRHYAPALPLRLNADSVAGSEALLAFGPAPFAGAVATRNLSIRGDLVEAAANLFAMLHDLERSDAIAIAVMAIPDHGLGHAINDRLRRGAEAGICTIADPA